MASATVENYVKALFIEHDRRGQAVVQLGRLAAVMGVVPGTVTTMARTLSDAGLVHYEPRVGLKLTSAGRKLALHVLRRHRLVELFLVQVLGYDWAEVHDEAEELEHVISDKLLEKIDTHLGSPRFDPHGDPIPDGKGRMTAPAGVTLSECAAGTRWQIVRIDDQDPQFLNFATQQRLTPGRTVTVMSTSPIAGAMTLRHEDRGSTTLGHAAAERVRVVAAG